MANNKHHNPSLFNRCLSVSIGLILFIPLLWSPACALQSNETVSLTFLTWSEYADPELIHEFEQKFNAKINFVYYETDDARDSMMVETNGQSFDLILVSGLMVNQYIHRGWLDVINYSQIPNIKHIHSRWLSKKAGKNYKIPYFWGALGIAYRRDLVKEQITSWKQLFIPDESLKGKILMINNAREVTAVALKSLGYSGNTNDLNQIREASALLHAQKPYVKSYSYLTVTDKSPLVTGEIIISMIYSGDALALKDQHPDIVYVLPEEGGVSWVDFLTIGQGSTKKKLAMKFIDFINEPKNAARNADFVYYSTPNKSAEHYLSQEFLNNPVIYPSNQDKKRLEFLDTLPAKTQRVINSIMVNLTSQ